MGLHLLNPNWRIKVGRNEVIEAMPRHSAPYTAAVKYDLGSLRAIQICEKTIFSLEVLCAVDCQFKVEKNEGHVIPSAILRNARSISALLKYRLPFLAMMSGKDGRKKSNMMPSPIAGIPSTIYSHCQAWKPRTPSRFLSTP